MCRVGLVDLGHGVPRVADVGSFVSTVSTAARVAVIDPLLASLSAGTGIARTLSTKLPESYSEPPTEVAQSSSWVGRSACSAR